MPNGAASCFSDCISANGSATWLASRGVQSNLGHRRDCVHHTQDRAANRAAARATARRLLGITASERQSKRFHLSHCGKAQAHWHHCRISSGKFSLTLALSNHADTRRQKKGRSQARETSEISFHSLRHSAVTMLKASGLSDVFAREIVGHESAAISRQYTHLTTDDLRNAMQRLPDVTNG